MNEELTKELSTVNKNMLEVQSKIMEATAAFQTELSEYRQKDAELRKAISTAMEESGTKKFENDFVALTYVAPTTRTGVDMERMRADHPKLAEKYRKETPVKASVRIKVK